MLVPFGQEVIDTEKIDSKFVDSGHQAMFICSMGRNLRHQNNLPTKLPLKKGILYCSNDFLIENQSWAKEIKDELFLKEFIFEKETNSFTVKLNYRVAGKKYKSSIKALEKAIESDKDSLIIQYNQKWTSYYFSRSVIEENKYEIPEKLDLEDLEFKSSSNRTIPDNHVSFTSKGMTLVFDASIDEWQLEEYVYNMIAHTIQDFRKKNGFSHEKPVWITVHLDPEFYHKDSYIYFDWFAKLHHKDIRFSYYIENCKPFAKHLDFQIDNLKSKNLKFRIEVSKYPFEYQDYEELWSITTNTNPDMSLEEKRQYISDVIRISFADFSAMYKTYHY